MGAIVSKDCKEKGQALKGFSAIARVLKRVLGLYALCIIGFVIACSSNAFPAPELFYYKEERQNSMEYLPQWLKVIERHIKKVRPGKWAEIEQREKEFDAIEAVS